MSKIICDVCGTSYQDSATQCPICGCVRPAESEVSAQAPQERSVRSENYTYVKGGRFSKANVQKRNRALRNEDASVSEEFKPAANEAKSDKGLVIAVCALLLAIVAVAIYIAIHFFAPSDGAKNDYDVQTGGATEQSTVEVTQAPTVEITTGIEIALSETELSFAAAGESVLLTVSVSPETTVDELVFASADEAVATVSADGEVTAVAEGETFITVTCGEESVQCKILCQFEQEATEETKATENSDFTDTQTGSFKAPYKISKTDVSISVGETFQLKLTDAKGEIVPVEWSPAVEDICKIEGNAVTGLQKGKTEVSATYDGQTFTCIIRVR